MIEIDEGVVIPDPFAQFLAGNDLAWTFQQDRQNLKGLPLNLDSDSTPEKLFRYEVELENSKAQPASSLRNDVQVPKSLPCAALASRRYIPLTI